jgi:hypothetical protein
VPCSASPRYADGAADTVTTLSGRDGSYLIVLPFERIDRSVNPPVRAFNRVLSVFAPRPALAAALAAQGFLAGQPANVFGLTAAQRNARSCREPLSCATLAAPCTRRLVARIRPFRFRSG